MAGLGKDKEGNVVKSEIDWEIVASLCKIQCTDVEIAEVIGVHRNTLNNRCKEKFDKTFEEYSEEHRMQGKSSLRRAQYKSAIEMLNPTMLIWLGKQYLDQKDKSVNENTNQFLDENGKPAKLDITITHVKADHGK